MLKHNLKNKGEPGSFLGFLFLAGGEFGESWWLIMVLGILFMIKNYHAITPLSGIIFVHFDDIFVYTLLHLSLVTRSSRGKWTRCLEDEPSEK